MIDRLLGGPNLPVTPGEVSLATQTPALLPGAIITPTYTAMPPAPTATVVFIVTVAVPTPTSLPTSTPLPPTATPEPPTPLPPPH